MVAKGMGLRLAVELREKWMGGNDISSLNWCLNLSSLRALKSKAFSIISIDKYDDRINALLERFNNHNLSIATNNESIAFVLSAMFTVSTIYKSDITLSAQSVIACQSQILRPLKSHVLLNLQMIQVQFGPSIQHMSGWHSAIGICPVVSSIPNRDNFIFYWFWNPVMSILYKKARNVRFVLRRNLGKTHVSRNNPYIPVPTLLIEKFFLPITSGSSLTSKHLRC